ncbi:hypothetical protein Bbelb_193360 [Branchiostoma belcheri]|nr:hypothetical protein Bbelb_193360 [Branchiostoma belcheri]
MKLLASVLVVIPDSTADSERAFSTLNRVKTRLRSSLKNETLHQPLTISIDGTDTESFDFEEAATTWEGVGIAIGFRKDLPQHKSPPVAAADQPDVTSVVTGSKHGQQVFIRGAKPRVHLWYSGNKSEGQLSRSFRPTFFRSSLTYLFGLTTCRYAVDQTQKPRDKEACRKGWYGHPSLTPGLFTIYCPHKVCYGFEAMWSCETPQHSFEILRARYETAPG